MQLLLPRIIYDRGRYLEDPAVMASVLLCICCYIPDKYCT